MRTILLAPLMAFTVQAGAKHDGFIETRCSIQIDGVFYAGIKCVDRHDDQLKNKTDGQVFSEVVVFGYQDESGNLLDWVYIIIDPDGTYDASWL